METFADGLAVRVAIPEAVAHVNAVVDRMLLVSERALAEAVGAYARAGIRVEGAAAAPLSPPGRAARRRAGPVVLVVSGRNIDEPLYARAREHPETFAG